MFKEYLGKFVTITAKDHASSINLDDDDYEMIMKGVARVIAVGFFIGENDDAVHVSSFFSDMGGKTTYRDIHSILKKEIEEINLLEVVKTIKIPSS